MKKPTATTAETATTATEAPPAVVIDPAGGQPTLPPHPSLDPGPAVTSSDTQNAREMNRQQVYPRPVDNHAVYSGETLEITPVEGRTLIYPRPYSGTALLTIEQEAAQRAAIEHTTPPTSDAV